MNIIKTMLCSALALLPLVQTSAQEQSKHELLVTGGLGLSSLSFSVDKGDLNRKMGGAIGVGYNYFLNNSFSINTGLELTFYNSESSLKSFTDSYKAVDTEGEFIFNTAVSDYKEKQRSSYLNIPIMAQYQLPVLDANKFYVALGTKIGMPLSGSYKTSDARFETTGTFGDKNSVTISDSPGLGFYEFTGKEVKEDLNFKVSFMLSFETGMKWALSPSSSLYTGVYLDYGLNDIRKDATNQKFLVYESPDKGKKAEDFQLNSMLQSNYTDGGATHSMTGKVIPMALGLKVKLAFSLPQ